VASYQNESDEFEDQGSSEEDDDLLEQQEKEDDSSAASLEILNDMAEFDAAPRTWNKKRTSAVKEVSTGNEKTASWMHTDDLSSDDEDEDGTLNRIGRVPLHWYDEYDHIGYDAKGEKVVKSASLSGGGDLLDQAIRNSENQQQGKYVVHDALNDKNVTLSQRQLEIIRRIQGGAYAHPEHDGNAEYIDYYSGVIVKSWA
jgi:ribosome biogenesis protein ERB1